MKSDLFTPDGIEKFIPVLKHYLFNQFFICIIAVCFYPAHRSTKKFRQLPGSEYHPGHYTKASATTTFQCPEQIRVIAGINDLNSSVGKHDFCLQKRCCRKAIIFGKTSKAATLNESGHANCY